MPRILIACKQSILPEITMGALDVRDENLFLGIISCSQWFTLWILHCPVKQFSKSHCKKNYSCYTELADRYMFLRNVSDKNMFPCEPRRRKPLAEICSICLFAHFYILLSKVYTFQNCLKFTNVLFWSSFTSMMPHDSKSPQALISFSDGHFGGDLVRYFVK